MLDVAYRYNFLLFCNRLVLQSVCQNLLITDFLCEVWYLLYSSPACTIFFKISTVVPSSAVFVRCLRYSSYSKLNVLCQSKQTQVQPLYGHRFGIGLSYRKALLLVQTLCLAAHNVALFLAISYWD